MKRRDFIRKLKFAAAGGVAGYLVRTLGRPDGEEVMPTFDEATSTMNPRAFTVAWDGHDYVVVPFSPSVSVRVYGRVTI